MTLKSTLVLKFPCDSCGKVAVVNQGGGMVKIVLKARPVIQRRIQRLFEPPLIHDCTSPETCMHDFTNPALHGQVLEAVSSARYWYLALDISSNLSWNTLVNRTTVNASGSVGYIKRNVKTKSPLSNSFVRPQLEYASAAWDPHTHQVEMAQSKVNIL